MTEADEYVPCAELRPFLKMLCDDSVLGNTKSPNQLDLREYSKIHNLVYLARQHFKHPKLAYEYDSIIDGPFSLDLSNELYDIDDMHASSMPDDTKWRQKEQFREFAKHKNADWIQIAATIFQINEEVSKKKLDCAREESKRDCVIRHVTDTQVYVDQKFVASVYDDVEKEFRLDFNTS